MAALDAFLRCQFTRFFGLQFDSIECKLRNQSNSLILKKEDVEQLLELTVRGEISTHAKAWDIEPYALLELLETDLARRSYAELHENPTFSAIYQKLGYDLAEAKAQCQKLASLLVGKSPNIDKIRSSLRHHLQDVEIVYLPTYRRIELSLPERGSRRGERRKSILSRLGVAKSGLYTADIQFGLSDISDRLRALHSDILHRANQGYGKISANVVNDLISGEYRQQGPVPRDLPPQESLELFFSRIKDAEVEYRRTPFGNYFKTPDLNQIYSGQVPEDSKPFLNYFLGQLNSVIEETRGTEDLVEAFITNCNRYLSGKDDSADGYDTYENGTLDDKRLTFNRRNLEVTVTSIATSNPISLEALSSGEKQMISLFARLYLYPKRKIVLIDEPELSLSLDWQRQILPDVLRAPTCDQVIAITHSPFIFDNDLQPFAGSLRLKINPPGPSTLYSTPQISEEDVELPDDE